MVDCAIGNINTARGTATDVSFKVQIPALFAEIHLVSGAGIENKESVDTLSSRPGGLRYFNIDFAVSEVESVYRVITVISGSIILGSYFESVIGFIDNNARISSGHHVPLRRVTVVIVKIIGYG
ncbi:MAG: hypothetical protein UW23_C0034G0011 [Candidatus Collierbacteria bacterium GW2011_GWA1_44_12]|uniref:Uncharacterized protein n=1 Tax=Candidatus Collierbacteria bacterium GW2011_GWA1_44_12 TaxID=1618376 RepID=A0A0G1IS07_9BACT|nr:MAG: hypothetical protein UW23_C0034G0011 [Candidatus Collierbacteria bacterium GW2011_GWA1_44_12]